MQRKNKTTSKLRQIFEQTLTNEDIDRHPTLLNNFDKYYLPLTNWINEQHQSVPVVIGINGSQGSGKSTLSKILCNLLQQGFGKKVVTLSIDDLYKTRKQRFEMAESIHPLFKTRGVPGTHDIELAQSILSQLKQQTGPVRLPVFDKTTDDRKHEKYWPYSKQSTDIILFEGWCIGSVPEHDSQLNQAINELEKNEDSDSNWRQYVNRQLATDYQQLFSMIDKLIMLKIPDFDKVFEWRTLQENKLRKSSTNKPSEQIMSNDELKRFIMHFERITRHTLNEMPERADIILEIDHNHQINQILHN